MKLKEKLFKLSNPSTISDRSYQLIWDSNAEEKGAIVLKNLKNKKEAVGKFAIEGDQIRIKINSTLYGESYLKKIILEDLLNTEVSQTNILLELNVPKIGSIITTRKFIDQLEPGAIVDLMIGTYYYSVNSDLIDCNGWQLSKSFKGVFQGQTEKSCDNGSLPSLTYTIFRLIS